MSKGSPKSSKVPNKFSYFPYLSTSLYVFQKLIKNMLKTWRKVKSHNPTRQSKHWWFAISSLLIHRLAGAKSRSLGLERQVNHLVIKAQSRVVAKEDSLWLNQRINLEINIFNWLITTCSTGDLQWSLHRLLLKNGPCPFNLHASFGKDWIVIGFRWTLGASGLDHGFCSYIHSWIKSIKSFKLMSLSSEWV